MLEVSYEKIIPFPFDVVLSQYFDYEHVAHVHPKTLGEYRLVERDGDRIVYDQIWPPGRFGRRRVSRVVQRFHPPNRTTFEFVSGLHRGIGVDSTLHPHPEGTLVRETYRLPLPNWGWLRPLLLPAMMRTIDRVWEEDLRVEVCHGGWPGVPDERADEPDATGGAVSSATGGPPPPTETTERQLALDLGAVAELPPGSARCVRVERPDDASEDALELAVFHPPGGPCAVSNRCPHTGGPLALGRIEDGAVVCPWHGAAFDLRTGRAVRGPTSEPVRAYSVREEAGRLVALRSDGDTSRDGGGAR